MLQSEHDLMRCEIETLVEKLGRERSSLMPILHEMQRKYGYIPSFAMQVIADELGIHPVEVYSVTSFYAFLKDVPGGKFTIRVCNTISCDMAGKDRVARQLEAELGIKFGQTTPDGRFSLEYTACMGMCDQGPALLVNDIVFTRVTPELVHQILEECRGHFGIYAIQEEVH